MYCSSARVCESQGLRGRVRRHTDNTALAKGHTATMCSIVQKRHTGTANRVECTAKPHPTGLASGGAVECRNHVWLPQQSACCAAYLFKCVHTIYHSAATHCRLSVKRAQQKGQLSVITVNGFSHLKGITGLIKLHSLRLRPSNCCTFYRSCCRVALMALLLNCTQDKRRTNI